MGRTLICAGYQHLPVGLSERLLLVSELALVSDAAWLHLQTCGCFSEQPSESGLATDTGREVMCCMVKLRYLENVIILLFVHRTCQT
jgi:hypothetical protein